jgi:hypothetical protein
MGGARKTPGTAVAVGEAIRAYDEKQRRGAPMVDEHANTPEQIAKAAQFFDLLQGAREAGKDWWPESQMRQIDMSIAQDAVIRDLLSALKTTRGNIMSLGPAGALDQVPMPYREWLAVVDEAISKAEGAR